MVLSVNDSLSACHWAARVVSGLAAIEIRSWCLLDFKRLPEGWERRCLPIPLQSLRMDEELKGL